MTSDEAAATEDNGDVSDETLGSRLRAARESRELPLEKIADELRIEEEVLLALEEDRLADIDVAPVFVKGYIKQYGRALNLDYEELREAWQRQAESEDVRLRPNRAIHLRDERQITIWIVAALVVLLVAVALLVWWLGEDSADIASFGDASDAESVSVAAPLSSRVAQEPPAQPQPPAAQPEIIEPLDAVADEAVEDPSDDVATEDDQPEPTTTANVAAVAVPPDPNETDAAEPDIGDADPIIVVSPAPEPGSVEMLFDFSAESWFELTDARGRRLHYDLVEAGSQLRFMVLPPAQVLLGNANAASVSVNAEAFNVPASSLRGNVASFFIDPAGD
jgi:cytoskeleton protein RodZ